MAGGSASAGVATGGGQRSRWQVVGGGDGARRRAPPRIKGGDCGSLAQILQAAATEHGGPDPTVARVFFCNFFSDFYFLCGRHKHPHTKIGFLRAVVPPAWKKSEFCRPFQVDGLEFRTQKPLLTHLEKLFFVLMTYRIIWTRLGLEIKTFVNFLMVICFI